MVDRVIVQWTCMMNLPFLEVASCFPLFLRAAWLGPRTKQPVGEFRDLT
jgi:hypothetical protein